ncbi:hypothetical protein K470DRAFT_258899 [Piedraia hortae CBS 480.64]|uniref:Uncharacterized protein n=1 Tax=Piedraia hortae CBS 480.64 TaxID=1314780 RepID=A0A6A7BW96_9PEZI|nr:hypothetical protein K470DRAFT_258899 [Piedraia hortae CBS 480.64]
MLSKTLTILFFLSSVAVVYGSGSCRVGGTLSGTCKPYFDCNGPYVAGCIGDPVTKCCLDDAVTAK